MADIFEPQKRSQVMSRIRGKGNLTTEIRLRDILSKGGITGWRRHLALPGRPDFTFRKEKVCIFVHGCFWHGCPSCGKTSATNAAFWNGKIATNRIRDRRVARTLRKRGYKVVTIWECSLRNSSRRTMVLKRILRAIER